MFKTFEFKEYMHAIELSYPDQPLLYAVAREVYRIGTQDLERERRRAEYNGLAAAHNLKALEKAKKLAMTTPAWLCPACQGGPLRSGEEGIYCAVCRGVFEFRLVSTLASDSATNFEWKPL